MRLVCIDLAATDHAFREQGRSGTRTRSDDVNSLHPLGRPIIDPKSNLGLAERLRQPSAESPILTPDPGRLLHGTILCVN